MSSEDKENDDVEIISTHDEKAKIVGEILSNDSSRKILNLLNSNKELTINEIAQKTELSLSLVTHHIKRMQSAEVIKISRVGRSVKGQKMNYYCTTNQSFLIVPSKEPEDSLRSSLKKFSKFFAIGMAGIISWITLRPKNDAHFQSGESTPGAPTIHDESSIDKWDSAYQTRTDEDQELFVDSSSTSKEYEDKSAEPTSAPESKPEPVPESEPEPSHSGVVEYNFSEDTASMGNTVSEPTGSIDLDSDVYPVPYDVIEAQSSGTGIDPLFLSIVIPIVIVVAGIVIERVITRWYHKRRLKIQDKL